MPVTKQVGEDKLLRAQQLQSLQVEAGDDGNTNCTHSAQAAVQTRARRGENQQSQSVVCSRLRNALSDRLDVVAKN
eukprot:m.33491 g.33491  ORF g.33491 m.33491 type:complete len:76 (+) comp10414_c0_seq1:694-921(+)